MSEQKKEANTLEIPLDGFSHKKIHYENLCKAIQARKLLLFQYSSEDITTKPLKITFVCVLDYYLDQYYEFPANVEYFRQKLNAFFNEKIAENYYIAFWQYKADKYGPERMDLGRSIPDLASLSERCIDLEGALRYITKSSGKEYVRRVEGKLDLRWYFATLNGIQIPEEYLPGESESFLTNERLLSPSSNAKIEVMKHLFRKYLDGSIRFDTDEQIIEKTKKWMDWALPRVIIRRTTHDITVAGMVPYKFFINLRDDILARLQAGIRINLIFAASSSATIRAELPNVEVAEALEKDYLLKNLKECRALAMQWKKISEDNVHIFESEQKPTRFILKSDEDFIFDTQYSLGTRSQAIQPNIWVPSNSKWVEIQRELATLKKAAIEIGPDQEYFPQWMHNRYGEQWKETLLLMGTKDEKNDWNHLAENYAIWFLDEKGHSICLNTEKGSSSNLKKVILCQVYKISTPKPWTHRDIFQKLCQTYWDERGLADGVLFYNRTKLEVARRKIKKVLSGIKRKHLLPKSTLIVFPENVIPYACLETIIDFSTKYGVVFVGGMEHQKWGDIQGIFRNLADRFPTRFVSDEILSFLSLPSHNLTPETYLNLAVIVNGSQGFSFQHKHVPFFKPSDGKEETQELREAIPLFLKPRYFIFETLVGPLSVFICKDFLSNHRSIPEWITQNSVPLVAIPSLSSMIFTFQAKLGNMVLKEGCRKNLFALASIAEYGGSGLYCYDTVRLTEPGSPKKFPGRVEKGFVFTREEPDQKWSCS